LFFYNRCYKNNIFLLPILYRSYITFCMMWNIFGETKEHSIGYQEFNLKQTLIYLKELNTFFNKNNNKLYALFGYFFNKKLITSKLLKETSRKFLGFMLTNKKLYFPIGDSIREPSVEFLSKIFFPNKKIMDINEILYPYSVMNGSYSSESYFIYRNDSFGEYVHFACTCNWNSDAHKQNDELHFCLQLGDDIIFDDCGYTDFLSINQYNELASEFSHSSITINNHNYIPKKKTNNKSKILSSRANLFGFKVVMQHSRIKKCDICRIINFNSKSYILEINDEIVVENDLIGEIINFSFVLSPDINILYIGDKYILLSTKSNIRYIFRANSAFDIKVHNKYYAKEYPNLSFTNIIVFSSKISNNKNRYYFKLEKYIYKEENMRYDSFMKLKHVVSSSNIKYYVIKPHNVGFTDTFLSACVVSSFLDSLGLVFKGIVGVDKIDRSEYYQDLYQKINFKNTYNGSYYSIVDNNLDIDNIINEVKNLNKSIDTILLEFNYNHVLRLFELFPIFERKFFFSSFYGYFNNLTKAKITYDNKINITIHFRLGDEYPLFVNQDTVVNPSMLLRSRFDFAYYNIKNKKGYRVIQQRFNALGEIELYIKKLRQFYKDSVKINFISDGMDLGFNIVNREDIRNKLKKLGIKVDDEFLQRSTEQSIFKLNNLKKYCDEFIVGESVDKFIQTKNLLLRSNIIVSSARLFCWGVLSAFKYDFTFKQVLFMNNSGSYYDIIDNKNVKIEQYKNFNYCINNVFKYINHFLNKDIIDKIENHFNESAKIRIQNQLSYKLGQAMIVSSKSILGYIRMPFVLSYIYDKYKQEQKIYQEKIKKDPSLKLPSLENYPDYKEALTFKNHLSYKLGQALIKANKTWYKGGYIKMLFEIRELKQKAKKGK
ncbi:hypothetical protein CYA24_08805, partial [Campylobacter coli]|nr:hypothetical protein [Campylobacter coli]